MGDLTFNKIAAGVLATFLVIFLLQEVTQILFEREPPEHAGYAIAVSEAMGGGGGPEAPTGPPDWGTVLPTADIAAGEAIVQSHCTSCHHFDPAGTNGTGPGLFGVVGRAPGSHPGFSYSPAMTAFGAANHAWDYDRLWNFIGGPQRYIDGTRMTFAGLHSSDDRVKVIAYLRSLGSTAVPIPAPHPAAAPAAAAPAAGATNSAAAPAATTPAPAATNSAPAAH